MLRPLVRGSDLLRRHFDPLDSAVEVRASDGDRSLLGLIIYHPHMDHYGLADQAHVSVPGRIAWRPHARCGRYGPLT